MEVVLFILAISGVIWGLVLARHISIVVQLLGVIIAAAVIGHAFFNRSIGPIPITIDRVLLLFVMAQFAIQAICRRQILTQFNRLDLLVIVLFLFLTFSTLTHDWRYKDNLPIGRLMFFNWIPIVIYFLVRNTSLKTIDLKIIFGALCAFGLYLSLTAIAEVWGPQNLVFPSYVASAEIAEFYGRARGPFLNPVSCGVYQTVCMTAAMMFWPHLKKYGRAALIIAAPVFLAGVFLTLTRSIWLSAAWCAFIVFWLPTDFKFRAVLVTATTVALVLGLTLFGERLNGFKRDKNVTAYEMSRSIELRPMLATVAFRMFADRPVFGCGFGQYTKYKKPYHFGPSEGKPLQSALPYMQHNVFLSYLTELGLFGLTLLVCILIGFTRRAWWVWKNTASSLWSRQFGLLTLSVLSCYVLNGLFHDVSIIDLMGALLFYFGAVTVNLSEQSFDTDSERSAGGGPERTTDQHDSSSDTADYHQAA